MIIILLLICVSIIYYEFFHISKIKFSLLDVDIKKPTRGTKLSVGIDFYSPEYLTIPKRSDILIDLKVKVNLPRNKCLIGFNKSGIATKKKLTIGACVIDPDYQGTIYLHLFNNSDEDQRVLKNEKIVQFVLLPYERANLIEVSEDKLYNNNTERGTGAVGSTNYK